MIPRRARQRSNVVTNTPVYKSLSPEKPINVDHVYNQQLMIYAITHNDVNSANTLLNTVQIDLGESIVWAVNNNNLEITELLIQNGADINTEYNYQSLLMHAINNNYTDLAELLILCGADINTMYSITPMGAALNRHNNKIVALLLLYGANTQYSKNYDCVSIAVMSRDLKMIKLLLEGGANPNIQDEFGKTALMYTDNEEIIKLLLQYGADPNIQNNNGEVALELASYNIKLLLLKAGASIYKNGKIITTYYPDLNKIIENIHDANTAHMIGKKIFSVNKNGYDPSFNYYLRKQLSKYL